MGIKNSNRVRYIFCLSIVLVIAIVLGGYKYNTYQADLAKPKAEVLSISNTSIVNSDHSNIPIARDSLSSEVGNANYFNQQNGKYYADSSYTIEANDNTAYLLSLFQSEETVNLTAGNFLCKTKIVLNGQDLSVSGIEGKTKIVFDSKTFTNYGLGAFAECLIINKNYADEYKSDSAQRISISGIIFEYNRYAISSPKTIMLFKNIKGANINNCSFIADLANSNPVTNLDFYNGCKNVTVSDCYFSNKTKAIGGGCIWVRNLTTQSVSVEGNTTENIEINKCKFEKNSKDEVIAVYSVIGNVKDITIKNCDIKDYSINQQIVVSVFSSEDKYYGTVDNVIINNNSIYSQNFKAFVIMVGIENKIKPTTNVIISNNKIVTESQAITKTIIYNASKRKL